MRLILASASPRRSELLTAARIPFEVRPVEVDENPFDGEDPGAYVTRVARDKAVAFGTPPAGAVVLTADTTVVVDGEILGKPSDAADAGRMLRLLSGRWHEVLTGICLRHEGGESASFDVSRVRLLPLEEDEIAWYVGTAEPFGKAGAYAIQGLAARFIDRVEGSYSNVVGLPVSRVYQELRQLGFFA
ncbi:MAG: maf [Acidobacteria bacterium]|nr:maf [Acidobacteriota bacterium]